ncbi:MAG: recombinase family protein [Alphaproteobacteria bacterium]|nr:recombinase family protein [Alphaproteobacteria bacterium]
MEKALLYLRVSSKGQEDGYSLDAQEKLAYEYAKKKNLEIVKVWRGAESAWGRKVRRNFVQMLDYSKKHPEVKHIIFDVFDRMTRNDSDKAKMTEMIQTYGKVIHFSRPNKTYSRDSSPDDEFAYDIETAVCKKTSNDISHKTRMGMQEKAEQGIYPSNCPIGYINNQETKQIDVDPTRAPLIQELFSRVAMGGESLAGLADEYFAKGLRHKTRNTRLSKSSLHKIIHNPFYYGEFQWGHKIYKGTHTPLVSKEMWEKAVQTLGSKHRPLKLKRKFAFGGLLICGKCDCTILGEVAKGKYTYYRCSFSKGQHEHKGYIREEELAEKFGKVVQDIAIPEYVSDWLQKGVAEFAKTKEKSRKKTLDILKSDYTQAYKKLNRLYDLQLEGRGSLEMFSIKEKELTEELSLLKKAIDECGAEYEKVIPRAQETFTAINNITEIYNMATNEEKAKILRLLANQYTLVGRDIKVDYKEPFCYFAQAKKELQPSSGRIIGLPILDMKKIPSFTDDNSGSSRDSIWGG